ncbi:17238_t:CDS:2 [Acaulospora morrowiae]|uniref:17238_t:CDS:1 n=1 Tax=Acaulospora morrowiae TaxID=94023 RepID=A0A9N8Z039_9GLOM|nr:17238_t:CDS:2 [Acaulospora morrowiae]
MYLPIMSMDYVNGFINHMEYGMEIADEEIAAGRRNQADYAFL